MTIFIALSGYALREGGQPSFRCVAYDALRVGPRAFRVGARPAEMTVE